MVIKYTVVTATSEQKLDDQINIGLGNGWQPLGGVSVSAVHVGMRVDIYFSQAMVVYKQEVQAVASDNG